MATTLTISETGAVLTIAVTFDAKLVRGVLWTETDPTDGQVPQYNASGLVIDWVDPDSLITGGFVDVAGDTMTGPLVIDGTTDAIQLRVQGHSTQTADVFVVETSAGTDLFSVATGAVTAFQNLNPNADGTLDLGLTGTRWRQGYFDDLTVTTGVVASTLTGTLQTAAQPNVTSLGTLVSLQVDNLNLDGNTLSSTAGVDLLITPLAGQQIVLDGAIIIDAGVVTGATSITSTSFVGALTGNADTATALQTARTIGGVSFDGSASIVPSTITVADTINTTCSVALFEAATGALAPKSDAGLTYNAGTGVLTATGFSGPLTGAVTGNADTATTLQTPRDINGVAFDGSANITITAAAGTLTGTVLNATVVSSSLTSLGTIGSLVATTADIDGGTIDGAVIGGSARAAGSFSSLTLGTSVTITEGAADRLDLASGDSLNIVSGALQFAGSTVISSSQNLVLAGTGPHAIGGATVAATQLGLRGSHAGTKALHVTTALTPGLSTSASLVVVAGTIVEHASGLHPEFVGLEVQPPTITAGVATLANATTLKITGAPTATVTGAIRAFWVTSGLSEVQALTVVGTLTATLTGNADTATALATPRTIGGVSFDGSANIVPDTITVADTADATSFVGLWESATGDLAPKTDAALTYDATSGILTASRFAGPLTGNASTATVLETPRTIGAVSFDGSASIVPQTIQVVDSTDASSSIAMFDSVTGNLQPKTDAGLTYNATTGTLTATAFSGPLSGNATTATALATPRNIGGVAFDGTAAIVPQTIQVVDSTDASSSIAMFDSATGSLQPKTDAGLTYNATTGVLAATGFAGPLTGAVTGNADSATVLQTPRDINGVSFDGSTNITITAAAGTLTGTTLASNVVSSSLTSLGTIGSLVATQADIATLSRAGDQTIDLTGAATRTLTLQNSTASQVANLDVDGVYVWRAGHATGTFTFAGTPTVARTLTWPDASITVNAAADISGTTLASGVVTSSLTTIGTLVGGAVPANFVTAATFAAGTYSFAGSTISDLGSVTTVDINGGTVGGVTLDGTISGTPTWASNQAIVLSTAAQPNITALGTIISLVATTADINGGTVDGAVIGGSVAAAGSFTTLAASGDISASAAITIGDSGAPTLTSHEIVLHESADATTAIVMDAARSGVGQNIGVIDARWDGNRVVAMSFNTGADTVNKDEGRWALSTAAPGGSFVLALSVDENQQFTVSGALVGTTGTFTGLITASAGVTLADAQVLRWTSDTVLSRASAGIMALTGGMTISSTLAVTGTSTLTGKMAIFAGIQSTAADRSVALSGGSDTSLGANIILYGQTHSTKPDVIEFRHDAIVRGTMDLAVPSFVWTGTLESTGLITATAGVLYGTTVTLTEGAAHRLDLASGDDLYIVSGNLFIGVASNANMTQGLTINQGAADNEILAFASSDVTHGLLSKTETNMFFTVRKAAAATGGAQLAAFAGDAAVTQVFQLISRGGQATTDKTEANARGLLTFTAIEHDGSNNETDVTADGTVFAVTCQVSGSNKCRFLIDEDGDMWSVTAGQTFDEHDDLALVRHYDIVRRDGLRSQYREFARGYEDELIALGVLGASVAEGGMTNVTQLQRLHNGALIQLDARGTAVENCLRSILDQNAQLIGRDAALALLAA